MSTTPDYTAVQEITNHRFAGTSFRISYFDSIEEIQDKVLNYTYDIIIIAYHYRSEYYKHLNIHLQDVDYVIVRKHENESYIRYCVVIDVLMGSEIAGAIKPNDGLYLEDIHYISNPHNNRIPMYQIIWGC